MARAVSTALLAVSVVGTCFGLAVGLRADAVRHHPITAGDTITVHGLDYEVEGDPGVWQSPVNGRIAGVEVTLRRVVG